MSSALFWVFDYAASSDDFLATFRDNLSVPTSGSRTKQRPVKMGPMGCPATPLRNYPYPLRNNPEERSSQARSKDSQVKTQYYGYLFYIRCQGDNMSTKITINLYDNRVTPCYKIPHSWYPHTTRNSSYLLKRRPAKVDDLQKTPEWFSYVNSDLHVNEFKYIFFNVFCVLTALCCLHDTIHPQTTICKWGQN
jgi:hypothetical protein